jgi:putative ABC transport system permease protein
MFGNFLKTSIRNLRKDKVFTLVNFINLVIGFVTFILAGLVVFHELNRDKFNRNYERIYCAEI